MTSFARDNSNRQIAVEQDLLPKSDLAIDREAILILSALKFVAFTRNNIPPIIKMNYDPKVLP